LVAMVIMYTSLLLFWERGTVTSVSLVSFGRTAVVTDITVSAIDTDFHVFSTRKLHHIISIVMRAIPKLPLREKIMCVMMLQILLCLAYKQTCRVRSFTKKM
jgi:hypothetical protein